MPAECRREATRCVFSKASICIGAQQISEVDVGISELPSVEWPQLLRDFDKRQHSRRKSWFADLCDLQIPALFSNGDYKCVLKPRDNVVLLLYGHLGYTMF
jgi:hypothetical protein